MQATGALKSRCVKGEIMKNKCLITLSIFLFTLTGVCFADENLDIQILFARAYPKIQYKSIIKTDIDGLYEVTAGNNILYYYPKKNYIFFGEIWNGQGKSLTAERRKELVAVALQDLPLDEALKIGEGKNRVIIVTDPDCPFCRKLSSFLSEREDVTSYVYFFPLKNLHPEAENKAKFILSAENQAAAYHTVMKGKLDSKEINLDPATDERATSILSKHVQIAQRLGVSGTPTLWVNGTLVSGADIPRIKSLLEQKGGVSNEG
jgi:thiol:disulfide interchange protein DsbC